jgi:hypothetical protein
VVSAEQLSREEVVAFLGGQPGTPEDLEALSGGSWSSAWAYRAGGEELVVRFGPQVSWYEADRMAVAFAGPDLPVPEVREVGSTPSGRAYAISVRHHGRFLEDTPVEQAGAIAPALTRLSVRAEPGALLDAAARHHCYELHIGFTHLGWNVWSGKQADLAATARRLAEVLERGPLPLTSARPSAET